jgi:hypothetical protein
VADDHQPFHIDRELRLRGVRSKTIIDNTHDNKHHRQYSLYLQVSHFISTILTVQDGTRILWHHIESHQPSHITFNHGHVNYPNHQMKTIIDIADRSDQITFVTGILILIF